MSTSNTLASAAPARSGQRRAATPQRQARRITGTSQASSASGASPGTALAPTVDPAYELMTSALGHQEVTVTVPEGATLPQVESYLRIAINGSGQLSRAQDRIRPMIGLLLRAIRDRRLYAPDFKNITDYIQRRVVSEWGFSRPLAFATMSEAAKFPTVDRAKYNSSTLLNAARITSEEDPEYPRTLDLLASMPVTEQKRAVKEILRAKALPAGGSPSPAPPTIVLSMRLPEPLRQRWDATAADYQLSSAELLAEALDALDEREARLAAEDAKATTHVPARPS